MNENLDVNIAFSSLNIMFGTYTYGVDNGEEGDSATTLDYAMPRKSDYRSALAYGDAASYECTVGAANAIKLANNLLTASVGLSSHISATCDYSADNTDLISSPLSVRYKDCELKYKGNRLVAKLYQQYQDANHDDDLLDGATRSEYIELLKLVGVSVPTIQTLASLTPLETAKVAMDINLHTVNHVEASSARMSHTDENADALIKSTLPDGVTDFEITNDMLVNLIDTCYGMVVHANDADELILTNNGTIVDHAILDSALAACHLTFDYTLAVTLLDRLLRRQFGLWQLASMSPVNSCYVSSIFTICDQVRSLVSCYLSTSLQARNELIYRLSTKGRNDEAHTTELFSCAGARMIRTLGDSPFSVEMINNELAALRRVRRHIDAISLTVDENEICHISYRKGTGDRTKYRITTQESAQDCVTKIATLLKKDVL